MDKSIRLMIIHWMASYIFNEMMVCNIYNSNFNKIIFPITRKYNNSCITVIREYTSIPDYCDKI